MEPETNLGWRDKLGLIIEWDFLLALAAVGIAWLALPSNPSVTLLKDFYGLGASLLAIIFSVYFAGFTIVMSADDDDFIRYLASEGHFEKIFYVFKFTLGLLFTSLVLSVSFYAAAAIVQASGQEYMRRWWGIVFVFFLVWSMAAAMEAARTSLKHSQVRVLFNQVANLAEKAKKDSDNSL